MNISTSITDDAQIRAKKEAEFIGVVSLVQIVSFLSSVVSSDMPLPQYVVPMFHTFAAKIAFAAVVVWEAMGVTIAYFLRPRSSRLNIAKRICFVLFFILPLLAFRSLWPAIFTIFTALSASQKT